MSTAARSSEEASPMNFETITGLVLSLLALIYLLYALLRAERL
jgi:K+-transporting ATPase KdpF subunit